MKLDVVFGEFKTFVVYTGWLMRCFTTIYSVLSVSFIFNCICTQALSITFSITACMCFFLNVVFKLLDGPGNIDIQRIQIKTLLLSYWVN